MPPSDQQKTPGVSSAEPQAALSVPSRRAHTYEDDVSKAMNATDATVVQELLATARAKEIAQKEYLTGIHQRKWYGVLSALFLLLAAAGFGYALFHYSSLTVPAQPQVSVGVFPSTSPIAIADTDIRQTLAQLSALPLDPGKPALIPLVTDPATLAPLTKEQFFRFIEAAPSEPFAAMMGIVRLGVVNTGRENKPFVILSVPDAQIASKEFLIAEPSLLQLFYRALGIDLSKHVAEVGQSFTGTYLYNLPVRVLATEDPQTNLSSTTLLYGYVTGNTIVIATDPQVLKSVYDTIIRQQ